jgi:hypothetical protein
MKYTARINYDAIPSKGYKFQVEINNEECEAIDFISVNNDSLDTVKNELNKFIKTIAMKKKEMGELFIIDNLMIATATREQRENTELTAVLIKEQHKLNATNLKYWVKVKYDFDLKIING